MINILQAVTAVIVANGELLMVHRQRHLKSFAGFWAFPGGKVDAEDRHHADEPEEQVLLRALRRELLEEIGWVLPETLSCQCLGEATTPPIAQRRFRTFFYRIDLDHRPALTLDRAELQAHGWAKAADWLSLYQRGRLLLAPPTLDVLHGLVADPNCSTLPQLNEEGPAEHLRCLQPLAELRVYAVPSNTLPPAEHTNCFIFGHTMVDPSPGHAKAYAQVLALAQAQQVKQIFLTHHHPDHHEGAADLARALNLPVRCSQDTHDRIIHKKGVHWWANVAFEAVAEGDTVDDWQGEPVRALAVPGHDAGQLALMPISRAWCLVSDLIQGVGTVVVGGPEGNMALYFDSLQRIIDLQPQVVIPSHGSAAGSTIRLEETLAHRQQREQQLLDLLNRGKTPSEILAIAYPGLDPRLVPLARLNIQSHLDKLQAEGRWSPQP